jgi:hypothetical protein
VLAIALLLGALPWLLLGHSRPLLGEASIFTRPRAEQYFTDYPQLRRPYQQAVDFVRSKECRAVGLVLSGYDWEYPFWALLRDGAIPPIRLEHVDVKNPSGKRAAAPPFRGFAPCARIVVGAGEVRALSVRN